MTVAINARFLIPNKMEGFGRITYEVTKRLVENNPDDIFYLIFDRQHNNQFNFGKNAIPIVIGPPARHPILWYIWFEWSLSRTLKKLKPDVFFSPDGYLSLNCKTKTLLMVHDISFIHFPKFTPILVRKYYNFFTPRYLNKASKLITLTKHAKLDISTYYDIEIDKFTLTTVAAHGFFAPVKPSLKEYIKNKYTQGKDYFVYVGAIHPRKNITGLIDAFNIFKSKIKSDFKLLIVGNFSYKKQEVIKKYETSPFANDIIFSGYLDKDLYSVVGSAYALTYVSNYEGFGMPIVEAMNCHVPSITSNISSMPEVAQDTGILVDPKKSDEIADAMIKIVVDKPFYNLLVNNCIERKDKFNWEKTATDVYDELKKITH